MVMKRPDVCDTVGFSDGVRKASVKVAENKHVAVRFLD